MWRRTVIRIITEAGQATLANWRGPERSDYTEVFSARLGLDGRGAAVLVGTRDRLRPASVPHIVLRDSRHRMAESRIPRLAGSWGLGVQKYVEPFVGSVEIG